ncbi:hypothetical protein [Acidovorax sp. A1169]|uniref:hypothetical protein n=1 Tax=Acidovorax sp. A1169 TaxID=3059524 RepID=UPI0027378A8A|nr:hypothetical protein [Acidovorax sp. A1169]MDP4074304.1 hypothetical protein [Acidovorax sp. A1169]
MSSEASNSHHPAAMATQTGLRLGPPASALPRPPGSLRIRLTTTLPAPADWVATQLQTTALFRYITAPLLQFATVQGPWPTHWPLGDTELRFALFGLLPMGRQTARISVHPCDGIPGAWPLLRDNGTGQLMRVWDHRITVHSLPGAPGRTCYTDEVFVRARYLPWVMTPLSAVFAWVFYRHRQRRWLKLALRQPSAQGPEACA